MPVARCEEAVMKRAMMFSLCIFLAFSLVLGGAAQKSEKNSTNLSSSTNTSSSPKPAVSHKINSSTATGNSTMSNESLNGSTIQRALYVLIGITVIGVLYFLVRAVRVKKATAPRKKYGLLKNYDDSVEMAHIESDEEDDTTLYEARALRR